MSVDPVSLGVTIALTALNQGMTASRKIEGQRLDDLSVTVADYGVPCNYFVGTRRFDGVPIIWAEKLKEIKVKRKTKGGKLTNYEYLATFAFEVADHPCDAVTRIWFDKQLVYDITGAGPPSLFSIKKGFVLADHLRIYLGAEDQMPDPRMQATVDAEHGVGSTPAYRGKTTGVFEEIPVDKFGNRIPQIMVEAARSVSQSYPYSTIQTADGGNLFLSDDFSRLVVFRFGAISVIDLPSRTEIARGSMPQPSGATLVPFGATVSGNILTFNHADELCIILDETGRNIVSQLPLPAYGGVVNQGQIVKGLDGINWATITSPITEFAQYAQISAAGDVSGFTALNMLTATGASWSPLFFVVDGDGSLWAVGAQWTYFTATTVLHFYRVVNNGGGGAGYATVTGMPSVLRPEVVAMWSPENNSFVVGWEGSFYVIDAADFTVSAGPVSAAIQAQHCKALPVGAKTVWNDYLQEIELATLTVLRDLNANDWLVEPIDNGLYDPKNHGYISWKGTSSNNITIRYLDRVSGNAVTLRSFVELVHSIAGLDAGEANASLLTHSMRGYNWTQGSGQDILDPVLELYDVDARPHGFLLHYQPRGSAAGAAILYDNFAQVDADAAPYVFAGAGGTDLPRSISLTYADADADQEPNSARASRPLDAADGLEREQSIDMNTLVLTASEAKAMTDRLHRRQLFDAKPYQLPLTAQYVDLEPGDVRQLSLLSGVVTARLKSMAMDADRTISTEWLRDDPSVAVLGNPEGAAMAGHIPQEIVIPPPSRVAILDVPMATDLHDGAVPFLYFGAGPYGSGYFPGADIAISDSGLESDFEASWASVASNAAMDWGYALDSLSTSALPWIMDNATVLKVQMQNGTLESVTDAQLLANALLNLALVRNEYIQFRTATLQPDGTYNLTGLLRGRRGTEHEIANHAAGDQFILMNADIGRREVGAGEIGDFDAWRAVTSGRDIDGAFEARLTFAANAHRPYSPVQGIVLRDTGSGDWSINAIRRTRIGGNQWLGGTLPLGEASESWQADIMDGAVVKRTLTGTSLPLTYTAAQQTADWGAVQTSLTVNLYQMNPTLGLRGFPLNIAA